MLTAAGVGGLSLWAGPFGNSRLLAEASTHAPTAKSIIFLALYGGPPHQDTFDIKEDAPVEVRGALQAADVLLVPSYVENHPLVVLEALCASVPVIGYAAGGMAAMIEHGTHGLLANIGDRTALAANLTSLLDDPALHARMAHACFERQQTLPTWKETAAALKLALSST